MRRTYYKTMAKEREGRESKRGMKRWRKDILQELSFERSCKACNTFRLMIILVSYVRVFLNYGRSIHRANVS